MPGGDDSSVELCSRTKVLLSSEYEKMCTRNVGRGVIRTKLAHGCIEYGIFDWYLCMNKDWRRKEKKRNVEVC